MVYLFIYLVTGAATAHHNQPWLATNKVTSCMLRLPNYLYQHSFNSVCCMPKQPPSLINGHPFTRWKQCISYSLCTRKWALASPLEEQILHGCWALYIGYEFPVVLMDQCNGRNVYHLLGSIVSCTGFNLVVFWNIFHRMSVGLLLATPVWSLKWSLRYVIPPRHITWLMGRILVQIPCKKLPKTMILNDRYTIL